MKHNTHKSVGSYMSGLLMLGLVCFNFMLAHGLPTAVSQTDTTEQNLVSWTDPIDDSISTDWTDPIDD